jgi:hypothetical protein
MFPRAVGRDCVVSIVVILVVRQVAEKLSRQGPADPDAEVTRKFFSSGLNQRGDGH